MLSELHLEHLGVVERLDLVLGPGLTAITGETGAGKTMLVDALELLVGGRADPSIVRPGCAEARVDGRFVTAGGEVVLTRVVPAEGRSRAYVDGRPATIAGLAAAAEGLVELHGQHAHQSLLSVRTQRAALDGFGAVDLAPWHAARARLAGLHAELAAIGGDERARSREVDLLRFQVAELAAAAIEDAGEDARLEVEEDALADATGHRQAAAVAHGALTDDGGARDAVAGALLALGDRAPLRAQRHRVASILAELDDVAAEIQAAGEAVEDDPERLEAVRSRRRALRDLCRKYGDSLADVLAYAEETSARLAELEGHDERAAELERAQRAAAAEERRAAAAVGAARRAAAPRLAAAVTARLRALALPHAELAVDVDGASVRATGSGDDDAAGDDPAGERVTFLFSANPGAPLLPLTKVASGGELARAMLALRLVLSGLDASEAPARDATYVFDEVDAGIGGRPPAPSAPRWPRSVAITRCSS